MFFFNDNDKNDEIHLIVYAHSISIFKYSRMENMKNKMVTSNSKRFKFKNMIFKNKNK